MATKHASFHEQSLSILQAAVLSQLATLCMKAFLHKHILMCAFRKYIIKQLQLCRMQHGVMLVVCIVMQDMSQAINCNYARTAIRVLCQREYSQCGSVKQLSQATMVKVVDEYNKCFSQLRPCH
jgi:glutaredoxin-related protein